MVNRKKRIERFIEKCVTSQRNKNSIILYIPLYKDKLKISEPDVKRYCDKYNLVYYGRSTFPYESRECYIIYNI